MKKTLLVLALAVGCAPPLPAITLGEYCSALAFVTHNIAKGRDKGIGRGDAAKYLTSEGLDGNTVAEILNIVYIYGKDLSPDRVGSVTYESCIKQKTT